jgi:hypothetical protein
MTPLAAAGLVLLLKRKIPGFEPRLDQFLLL